MSDLLRGALPLLLLGVFWPVILLAILDDRTPPPPTEQHRECVNPKPNPCSHRDIRITI